MTLIAKKKFPEDLPRNWRLEVVKKLALQSVTITSDKVRDVCLGKVADKEIVKKVESAVAELKIEHKETKKSQRNLRKLVGA
jgi:hypothetical protein